MGESSLRLQVGEKIALLRPSSRSHTLTPNVRSTKAVSDSLTLMRIDAGVVKEYRESFCCNSPEVSAKDVFRTHCSVGEYSKFIGDDGGLSAIIERRGTGLHILDLSICARDMAMRLCALYSHTGLALEPTYHHPTSDISKIFFDVIVQVLEESISSSRRSMFLPRRKPASTSDID